MRPGHSPRAALRILVIHALPGRQKFTGRVINSAVGNMVIERRVANISHDQQSESEGGTSVEAQGRRFLAPVVVVVVCFEGGIGKPIPDTNRT